MSNRRQFLKTTAAGIVAGGGCLSTRQVRAAEQPGAAKGAAIKVAGYDYDRVRAIMDGRIGIEGAEVRFVIETTESSDGGKVKQELDRYFLPNDFPSVPCPGSGPERERQEGDFEPALHRVAGLKLTSMAT